MKDEIKEQLSALVDGELGEHEHALLLRRMQADAELRHHWERYHLIHDALHNELPQAVDMSLADRIMADIHNEPHPLSTPAAEPGAGDYLSPAVARIVRPLSSLAVAASLAVLSLFGVQNVLETEEAASSISRIASAEGTSGYVASGGTRWDTARSEIEKRLTTYLVNHNEYSSTTNLQGMIPYVRIAGYDIRR